MKFLLSLVLVLSAKVAFADNKSDLYFQIGEVTTSQIEEDVNLPAELPVMGNCEGENTFNQGTLDNPIDNVEVIVDKIINIGKKIWSVIEAGRPVVNVKTDVAHALPSGIKCWSNLENWQAPQSKIWKVTYHNKLGNVVAELIYRLSYIAGGQYKGIGHYITQATIIPAKIYVNYGFKFNMEGAVPSVFNIGTRENPIAGMQMNVKWTLDSVASHHQAQADFFIDGNGTLQKME